MSITGNHKPSLYTLSQEELSLLESKLQEMLSMWKGSPQKIAKLQVLWHLFGTMETLTVQLIAQNLLSVCVAHWSITFSSIPLELMEPSQSLYQLVDAELSLALQSRYLYSIQLQVIPSFTQVVPT
jgi:hypothetical protein